MATKRIGFVDDDLDNFHANTYLDAIRGPLYGRGWEVYGATAIQSDKGAEWSDSKSLHFFDSVDELAKKVDVFAVLAPSTPDTHMGLCEQVLPYSKPTFVDKTFAPDSKIASQIFSLADKYNTSVQTTSALRTTNIQNILAEMKEPLVNLSLWAGGASLDEYGIHPLEIAVSCLGPEAERLLVAGTKRHPTIVIEFSRGRIATIDFNSAEYVPFVAMLTTDRGSKEVVVDDKRLFTDAAAAILDFYDAGKPLVPREETMAVITLLDALKKRQSESGWISLNC